MTRGRLRLSGWQGQTKRQNPQVQRDLGNLSSSKFVNLDGYFTAATWGTGYNGDERIASEQRTARDGRIPELLLFDLSAHYQATENVRIVAGLQNIFDEQKLVSRIPEGPRANAPRMVFAGVEVKF